MSIYQVENSLLVPDDLYYHLNYKDDRNRQKAVMVPAMYDNPRNQTATLSVQRTNRVVQPQLLLRAHDFLAIQCRNPYVVANNDRLVQLIGSEADQQDQGNLTSFVLCIKLGGCFEIFII